MDAPDWIWRAETDLTLVQKAIYAVLLSYRQRDQPAQRVWPAYETIATDAGVSRSTVIRNIRALAVAGLVDIHRRPRSRDGTRRDETNEYTVRAPERRPARLRRPANAASEVLPDPARPGVTETRPGVTETQTTCHGDTGIPAIESLPENPSRSAAVAADHERHDASQNDEDQHTSPASVLTVAASPLADDEELSDPGLTEIGLRDRGEPSVRQIAWLTDLYVHARNEEPSEEWTSFARGLDQVGVTVLARKLHREIGHHSSYAGPEPGTPQYLALSETGRRWADAQMVPDDLDRSTPTTEKTT